MVKQWEVASTAAANSSSFNILYLIKLLWLISDTHLKEDIFDDEFILNTKLRNSDSLGNYVCRQSGVPF